jgi:hypothetical protein
LNEQNLKKTMKHRKSQTKTSQLIQSKLRTSNLNNDVFICFEIWFLQKSFKRFKQLFRLNVTWKQKEKFFFSKEKFFLCYFWSLIELFCVCNLIISYLQFIYSSFLLFLIFFDFETERSSSFWCDENVQLRFRSRIWIRTCVIRRFFQKWLESFEENWKNNRFS